MTRRTHPTRKRAGLTLLEVILSLAIFLFSLVAIGHLMTLGTERATEVRAVSRATALAQSKMGEVIAGVLPLSAQGETPFDHEPDYVWSVDCQQDSVANLWDVQVKVSRTTRDGSNGIEVVVQQMVLDPTARGSQADVMASTDTGTTSSSPSSNSSSGNTQGQSGAGAVAAPAAKGATTGGTTGAATGGRTGGTTGAATGGTTGGAATGATGGRTGGATGGTTGGTMGGTTGGTKGG